MKYLLDYMDCKDIEIIDIMAYCRHTHKVARTVCKPHAHTTTSVCDVCEESGKLIEMLLDHPITLKTMTLAGSFDMWRGFMMMKMSSADRLQCRIPNSSAATVETAKL